MKKIPLLFCLVIFLSGFASAQTNQNANCPTFDVSGGGVVEAGESMSFTAHIDTKGKNMNLKYVWSVSAGIISSGQGELSITVDTVGLAAGQGITATIEVDGFPKGCPNSASETGTGDRTKPSATLVDEFGGATNGGVKLRMDEFYVGLSNNPNAQGYIINYGTDKEIAVRERQIRTSIAFRKYDASRITIIRGGIDPNGQNVWTKFWLVPPGAEPPMP